MNLRSWFSQKFAGKKARILLVGGLVALVALQLYFVQEMIAAFVIFCVLFALAAGAGLLLFVLDRASERTLAWAEVRTPDFVRLARRGWNFVGEFSKKPLHRREAA